MALAGGSDAGRRTKKKKSVCSWVEQHGLLDEPRTWVIGFCMKMPKSSGETAFLKNLTGIVFGTPGSSAKEIG